jgi:Domain of unknown function (DUF4326)
MQPQRIQLRRTKGWRMPPNTIKIDRTTQWGNPYKIGTMQPHPLTNRPVFVADLTTSLSLHRDYLLGGKGRPIAKAAALELRGKNLACWCKSGGPCHGDMLLKIANH